MIKKNVIGSIAPFRWYGGKQSIARIINNGETIRCKKS